MKHAKYIYLIILLFPLILLSQSKGIIVIQNNTDLERKEAVVAIRWDEILKQYPKIDTSNFVVINTVTKKQIPYQLEHKGLPTIQNLLVQVDVKSNTGLQLFLQKGKPVQFKAKTYARYVPERLDDFAWENDRIAFRAYGKALEGTRDDAYGIDVWVKRTDRMIINERYKVGDYHTDHGDGLDYYKVGYTLGAGSMAPYIKDSVRYSGNYHKWKVLDNGPLRSTFQLEYDEWDAAGIKVSCVKTISIDAGSQLNRIENVFTYVDTKLLPVAVGISKRPENGFISLNEQEGIMAYWEPTHGNDGTTGVGCILTTPVKNMLVEKEQLLAVSETKSNEPVIYYAGAAWDKAGKILNSSQWVEYLNLSCKELKNPLKVEIE
ncbi:DUF4861 family protein [Flavobacterium sp. MAHUQ-51]|uniref:DUF4861 family protein n=1 Tax=Flavobacterium sp. GCM10022190 TaxID=3252639 RepID=UPI0036065CEC